MTTYDIILKRRSIRQFNEQDISDEDITLLLKSAMAAPSACNKRPWEFYIIKNINIQNELKKVTRYVNMNSRLIIVVAGNDKRSLAHRVNDFWIQDCSAAIENMLLVATELGISSCWCGLFPLVTPVKKVREILKLDENIIPLALVQLGYSSEKSVPRTQYNEKYVHIIE